MSKEKTLIMTVGLPYAGKSSWALTVGVPIVSPDAIRLALHGQRYVKDAEELVWFTTKAFVRALFRTGYPTIILDATMVTKKRRDVWVDDEWDRRFKIFNLSREECIVRAQDEEDMEIIPTIVRMSKEFEPLTEGEEMLILSAEEEKRLMAKGDMRRWLR